MKTVYHKEFEIFVIIEFGKNKETQVRIVFYKILFIINSSNREKSTI